MVSLLAICDLCVNVRSLSFLWHFSLFYALVDKDVGLILSFGLVSHLQSQIVASEWLLLRIVCSVIGFHFFSNSSTVFWVFQAERHSIWRRSNRRGEGIGALSQVKLMHAEAKCYQQNDCH